ncbi:MAG: fimbrillin family protein [Bacteroidales bacterium]|nr:fimbrillin family protein [Bacteroidales bacterium]
MKRISIILAIASLLVMCMTGCGKHKPDSDPNAWMEDLSLPVPINFGSSSLTKSEINTMDGVTFGVFAVEHGDASQIDWKGGPSLLLNNVTATKDPSTGMAVLDGGPYYYPMDNHRNFSFYGYYPTTYTDETPVSVSRADESLVATMRIKDNQDILWSYSLAKTTKASNGTTYSGFNGRYIRKVVLEDNSKLPKLEFKHLTTNLVFNAKANKDLTPEEFATFAALKFKITGVTLNPITNTNDDGLTIEKKIPRYAKLYLAVENSTRDENGMPVGTSPSGYKPGDLVGIINEGDIGKLSVESPNVTFPEKNVNYQMAQFFMVPFHGVEDDKLNLTIAYSTTVGEKTKNNTFDVQIDISDKTFEAGKKYMYNIIFYPPELIEIGIDDSKLGWELGNGEQGEDIDQG